MTLMFLGRERETVGLAFKIYRIINKIEKITNTPSFYYSKNENNFHDIYIELNAPFKMIKLYHTNRLNIIQTGYDGISIHESNNFTHIINFNKIKKYKKHMH